MKLEELTQENVGKPVRVYLDHNYDNARAKLFAWSGDHRTVYVRLTAPYGKGRQTGTTVEVPIESVRLEKSAEGK